jgi:inorganic pyrophosphatase
LTELDTYDQKTGDLNIVVETPQGSRNKYKYDAKCRVFKIHSVLPLGAVFPYDFGFLPSTLGEDGDPLDILVLMEEPAPGGYLVPARLLGVIEAEQTEKDGTTERNDRLIAVSNESHRYQHARALSDLTKGVLKEIEHFFVSYNEMEGKKFKPLGCHGPERARKLVKEGAKRLLHQKDKGKKKVKGAGQTKQ